MIGHGLVMNGALFHNIMVRCNQQATTVRPREAPANSNIDDWDFPINNTS